MKVLLMGYKNVQYTKKDTGEYKDGMSLFIAGTNSQTVGLATDSRWVNRTTHGAICNKIESFDLSEPVWIEIVEDAAVGSRYPDLVDIVLVDE